MSGIICDIKRMSIHDGPGIRTTVFFKGCSMGCVWCHNPETQRTVQQLAFYEHKCIGCGACVRACSNGAHRILGSHKLRRELCSRCGACVRACPREALMLYGRSVTAEELLSLLLEDRDFYGEDGGVTFSGGECTLQPDFLLDMLIRLKREGIHTAVDTAGYTAGSVLKKLVPFTDLFLYDLKAIDEEVHLRCTGKPNKLILENLRLLDSLGCSIEIRYPYVPGRNDNQAEKIRDFLATLSRRYPVKVLPYHNLAGSKYAALNIKNTLPDRIPSPEEIARVQALFQ